MKFPRKVFLLSVLQGIRPVFGSSDPSIVRSGVSGAIPIVALAFLGFILPRFIKRDQSDLEN